MISQSGPRCKVHGVEVDVEGAGCYRCEVMMMTDRRESMRSKWPYWILAISLGLMGLALFGCTSEGATNVSSQMSSGEIKSATLDGCEYVVLIGYNKGGICHKANCKNH